MINEKVDMQNIRGTFPIPEGKTVDGWKDVEILECGEELVPLSRAEPYRISIEPQYFMRKITGAPKECFVRESVAAMLRSAAHNLPSGYRFVIWDAWRPLVVQGNLFESFKGRIKRQHPEWDNEKLEREAQRYVSIPSTDRNRPSPHFTGGAIDLTIKKSSSGYLEMGTGFDDFTEIAYTRYYELKAESGAYLSSNETVCLRNRRVLFHLLAEAGFTNYPEEWWHFDYGDQFWAWIKNTTAVYGGIDKNVSKI